MGSSRQSKSTRAKSDHPEGSAAPLHSSPRDARQRSTARAGARPGGTPANDTGCGDVTSAIERRRPRIRGVLGDSLQAEITALEKARSVVDCLAAAMEAGATSGRGPYYPDVAHAASQMMTGTISRLSDLLLDSPEGLL